MAIRTNPQFQKPPATPKSASDEPPRPRFEDRVEFEDLGKYEEVTLPPNQRLQWLAAKLPSAPPDLLQDTVPPNGGVKAPAKPEPEKKSNPVAAAGPIAATATKAQPARATEPSSDQETVLVPRVRRRRRLRGVVIGAVALGFLLVLVGLWIAQSSGEDPATTTEAPSEMAPARNAPTASIVAPPLPAPDVAEPAPAAPAATPEPRDWVIKTPATVAPTSSAPRPRRVAPSPPQPPADKPAKPPDKAIKPSSPAETKAPGSLLGGELARPPAE